MDREKSALGELEKKLDSRQNGVKSSATPRSSLQETGMRGGAQRAWSPKPKKKKPARRINILEFAFIGSIVFFVFAAALSSFLFFSGNNTVSTRNVTIAVDGPTEIRAGETMTLQVVVTNRNSVPMELADLVVEFPSGTRSDTDVSVELPRIRETLGTINPGESINKTIRAVVFGSAETEAVTRVTVEYRVPSSNAIFYGEEDYAVLITQSPASIIVDGLDELTSGQETSLTVTVTSNVPDVLSDMLLVVDYPPGFSFSSGSPAPFVGENVWRLGDIQPDSKREITIRGSFSGEDGDERVVKFQTGSEKEGVPGELAAPLAAGEQVVTLAKPFVSAALALGGSVTTEYVTQRGEEVRGDVRYTNNLSGRVQDVQISVKLSGAVLDETTVKPERGFYNSSQNTIVWNKDTNAEFADLPAGASGVLTFSLASLFADKGNFQNPEINLEVTVQGRRINESNVPETVEAKGVATILVATDLALVSAVQGVNGPVPPQADQPTTYTVNWNATNSSNAVANASASAVLPSYVKWAGTSDSAVSFNAVGGIITWNIGDLDSSTTRNTSFQVALTPSVSQVGNKVTLISDQRIYGFDRFARKQIERALPSLLTSEAVVQ